MKKIITILLVAVLVIGSCFALTACKKGVSKDEIKIGFIFLHDSESSYDKNFIDAANAAAAALGLKPEQVIMKTGIPEGEECTTAAEDLVDKGCNIIFADSFGHEAYLLPVARKNPDVQFCHATGTMAHTEGLDNMHNAFASIYEGRFLAGVAAGLKLYDMNKNLAAEAKNYKMGYVGAFTFAEVISGYTSFFLGAKYALNLKQENLGDSLTMDVTFTGSWYDLDGEKAAAEKLIRNNCALISGHADSDGVPNACEEAGVPNVFYNGKHDKSVYLCASRINWQPYFEYIITQVINGDKIATDYTGTLKDGSVEVLALGNIAAAGTADVIAATKTKLINGEINVFDVNTFSVTVIPGENGKNQNATVDANGKLTAYQADVDSDANYTADTQVVANGIFQESKFRSAPYFDLQINGITLLDVNFG